MIPISCRNVIIESYETLGANSETIFLRKGSLFFIYYSHRIIPIRNKMKTIWSGPLSSLSRLHFAIIWKLHPKYDLKMLNWSSIALWISPKYHFSWIIFLLRLLISLNLLDLVVLIKYWGRKQSFCSGTRKLILIFFGKNHKLMLGDCTVQYSTVCSKSG